jgi:hypothetical protein
MFLAISNGYVHIMSRCARTAARVTSDVACASSNGSSVLADLVDGIADWDIASCDQAQSLDLKVVPSLQPVLIVHDATGDTRAVVGANAASRRRLHLKERELERRPGRGVDGSLHR